MQFRYELINHLIDKHGYKNYLEIGTQNSINGAAINCEWKTGVDPNPLNRIDGDFKNHHKTTSDDFFSYNVDMFDIVFIDGLHAYDQVYKDLINSLEFLYNGGCIVLHDCLPTTEERAKSFKDGGMWNGDCYRLIQDLEEAKIKFSIYDFDQGCAVVYKKDLIGIDIKQNNFKLSFSDWQSKLKNKNIIK